MNSLDTTVDPCEDFYSFANGGWLRENPLPASKASWGQFAQLAQKNVQVIRDIIQRDIPSDATPADVTTLTKLKTHYDSCMDEAALAEAGEEPLLMVVDQVRKLYGGHVGGNSHGNGAQARFSAAESKTASKLGLTAAVSFLHSRGE